MKRNMFFYSGECPVGLFNIINEVGGMEAGYL